jgi:hypothetical protein
MVREVGCSTNLALRQGFMAHLGNACSPGSQEPARFDRCCEPPLQVFARKPACAKRPNTQDTATKGFTDFAFETGRQHFFAKRCGWVLQCKEIAM